MVEQWIVEQWDVPVSEIAPGNIIRNADDITVSAVERLPADGPYPNGYRVRGRITRGHGSNSRTERSWSYHADHVFPTVVVKS